MGISQGCQQREEEADSLCTTEARQGKPEGATQKKETSHLTHTVPGSTNFLTRAPIKY